MAEVALTQGLVALIDDADIDLICDVRWQAERRSAVRIYARHGFVGHDGKPHSIYMHRVISAPPPGYVVDHINGNGLDNRRSNLRNVRQFENTWNRRNITRETGVTWDEANQGWRACISHKRKLYLIGIFKDRDEAVDARCRVGAILRGDFAIEPDIHIGDRLRAPPALRALIEATIKDTVNEE